jgi:hypothetical protein
MFSNKDAALGRLLKEACANMSEPARVGRTPKKRRARTTSRTMSIIQAIFLTTIGITAYYLYSHNWIVDEETKGTLLIINMIPASVCFYYSPIEAVRNGSRISRVLYLVFISYIYTACLFGFVYTILSDRYPVDFTFDPPLKGIDSIYFSFTTLATVGYGDIHPKSDWAKFLVITEMLVGLIYTLVLFAIVSAYVTKSHLADKS